MSVNSHVYSFGRSSLIGLVLGLVVSLTIGWSLATAQTKKVAPVLDATGLFVVSKTGIVNRAEKREFVRIGERLSLDTLRRRFAKYDFKAETNDNENCSGVCVGIESGFLTLTVHDAGAKGIVSQIECRAGCIDQAGNSIGDSAAVIKYLVDCVQAEGNDLVCVRRNDLLHYEIKPGENGCSLVAALDYRIPSCAKISAFRIYTKSWIGR